MTDCGKKQPFSIQFQSAFAKGKTIRVISYRDRRLSVQSTDRRLVKNARFEILVITIEFGSTQKVSMDFGQYGVSCCILFGYIFFLNMGWFIKSGRGLPERMLPREFRTYYLW
jgi:hypothetical protein